MTASSANSGPATPGYAAPGHVSARGSKKRAGKEKRMCPVCGVNPIGPDEALCPACAEKKEMTREGLHVWRNWALLIVTFTLLLMAGKWASTQF